MLLWVSSATLAGEHRFVILHHDTMGCSVVPSHRIVGSGEYAENSMFRVGVVYQTEIEANAALAKIPECREGRP
jgi:hypothetical protein